MKNYIHSRFEIDPTNMPQPKKPLFKDSIEKLLEEAEAVIAQNGYEPLSEYERKEWRIAIQNAILGNKKDG